MGTFVCNGSGLYLDIVVTWVYTFVKIHQAVSL